MTITIKHIEGPLKGEEQTFDDSVDAVVFGRDRELAEVVYPPECDVVGRRHFELRRTRAGDYTVELYGTRYVEIDGVPADNTMPVNSGSTIRLGRKDGPAFTVEIGVPSFEGLPVTGDQSAMSTSTQRLGRRVAAGGSTLALVVAGVFAYFTYLNVTLADQLALARADAAANAETEFTPETLQALEQAVYLVARRDGGTDVAEGTAWAFDDGMLATNAHVTEAIKGHEDEFFLIAPNGDEIPITSVVSHPGYLTFMNYKTTQGTTQWGKFTPLDLISEYDVGIIKIDPTIPLPSKLEFAAEEDLLALAPGMPVASIGFPVEGLVGFATATKAPGTLHFGYISALTDIFMCRTDPPHRFLIQHSVPVAGGASGSPLIDPSGKVIGIVNAGNTTVLADKNQSLGSKVRVPSAALINFAQRVDLLEELAYSDAVDEMEKDQAYWDQAGGQFTDYFDVAVGNFEDLAETRYAVATATETVMGVGALDPGTQDILDLVSTSYDFEAKPGTVYGFIADAASGIPIGINIKNKETSEFVRDAKDDRKTSELELAPTAWITVSEPTTLEVIVWSFVAQPAEYELYAYTWPEPQPVA
jgi:hypothetical protein